MLETLLGSRLRAKILTLLFKQPDERYYVRQLASLITEDATNLSRELIRLEKTGHSGYHYGRQTKILSG